MGLHDRLNRTGNGAVYDLPANGGTSSAQPVETIAADPYAELKTRIHHACIAALGVELFKQEANEDITERVLRTVTEQLALDRTPLTREERRQLVREITDDILGYGPLEPFLRDDSVTEVMVNAYDRIYVERNGKLERAPAAFADNAHLLRIIDQIVSQVGRRVDESSPMVDARLPDGSPCQRDHPAARADGPDADDPEVRRAIRTRSSDLIGFGTITGKSAAVPRRLRARASSTS